MFITLVYNVIIHTACDILMVIIPLLMVCMISYDTVTGNKRLELAGSLLSLLFEDLFKRCVYSDVYVGMCI